MHEDKMEGRIGALSTCINSAHNQVSIGIHRVSLTHISHHRPALVDLSRFRASPILTNSRFRRFSTCYLGISGVSLVGISLLSADVAAAVVRPDRWSYLSEFSSREVEQGTIGKEVLVKAHTIVQ